MRTPHTACYRGKRVRVILRSGGEIAGRFEGRTHRWIVVDGMRIPKNAIRAFIIDKGAKA